VEEEERRRGDRIAHARWVCEGRERAEREGRQILCELAIDQNQGAALLPCARPRTNSNQRAPAGRPFDGAARSCTRAPMKGPTVAPSSPVGTSMLRGLPVRVRNAGKEKEVIRV
jgi:hypothetical protein